MAYVIEMITNLKRCKLMCWSWHDIDGYKTEGSERTLNEESDSLLQYLWFWACNIWLNLGLIICCH